MLVCLGLTMTACTGAPPVENKNDEILGWVQEQPIYASVVQDIAQRQGLNPDQALAKAADTLRLYLAYLEDQHIESPSPELKRFLTLQGAVRVWLNDNFEPQTEADKIPTELVKATLDKVASQGRPFGPQLHGLCQVIVTPADAAPSDDARQRAQFESTARQLIADMEEGLQRALPELLASERCDLFDQLTELIAAKRPENIRLKRESLLLDLSSSNWDQDFVDKVAPLQEPALLAPFMTKFGLHLVYVSKVFPAHLAADKEGAVSPATQAERDREMRSLMLDRWRSDQMKALLEKLRKRELIEWVQPPGT